MSKPLLDDELWEVIEPLLPPPKPRRKRYPGRKPIDDRRALTGILFVLRSGIPLRLRSGQTLGDAAPGDGLWLRHDLLEKAKRLA